MATEPTQNQQERLRHAYQELIRHVRPNVFLTFNFGYLIAPLNAHDRMKGFCAALERKAHGRNYTKRGNRHRLLVVGFPERLKLNPHWHAVARVPDSMLIALKTEGEAIWLDWEPRGQLRIEEILDQAAVRSYSTKHLAHRLHVENVFVYWVYPPKLECRGSLI